MGQAVRGYLAIGRRKDSTTGRKPADLRSCYGLDFGAIGKIGIVRFLQGHCGIDVKAIDGRISGRRKRLCRGAPIRVLDSRGEPGDADGIRTRTAHPVCYYGIIGPAARWRAC